MRQPAPGPVLPTPEGITPLSGRDHPGRDHPGRDHSGRDHSGRDHSGRDHSGRDHSGRDRREERFEIERCLYLKICQKPLPFPSTRRRVYREDTVNGHVPKRKRKRTIPTAGAGGFLNPREMCARIRPYSSFLWRFCPLARSRTPHPAAPPCSSNLQLIVNLPGDPRPLPRFPPLSCYSSCYRPCYRFLVVHQWF